MHTREDSVTHYVNGKLEVARASGTVAKINHGQLAVEAAKAVEADPQRWGHGKSILKRLRADFQAAFQRNLITDRATSVIAHGDLRTVAKKVFKKAGT